MTETQPKETPRPTPQTQPFWDGAAAGRLDLPYCQACSQYFWYPRLACPQCGSRDVTWRTTSGTGSVWSYVTMHRAAPGFEADVPYVVALIELSEGPRLLSNVVGSADGSVSLGADVTVEFERRADMSIPVFRVTDSEPS